MRSGFISDFPITFSSQQETFRRQKRDSIAQWSAYLLLVPVTQGLIAIIPKISSEEKIDNCTEVN